MTVQHSTDWLSDTDVPGVYISDNGARKHRSPSIPARARLEGTGLDVWEVINSCRTSNWEKESVVEVWPHLPRELLEAAFIYYARHPEEIDARLVEEDFLGPDWTHKEFPRIDPQSLLDRR